MLPIVLACALTIQALYAQGKRTDARPICHVTLLIA